MNIKPAVTTSYRGARAPRCGEFAQLPRRTVKCVTAFICFMPFGSYFCFELHGYICICVFPIMVIFLFIVPVIDMISCIVIFTAIIFFMRILTQY